MRQKTRDDLGLAIDMLDSDRLRQWAENVDTYGNDISHWSDRRFVIEKLRDIAGRIETTVREIGTLRELVAKDALPPSSSQAGCKMCDGGGRIRCPECEERRITRETFADALPPAPPADTKARAVLAEIPPFLVVRKFDADPAEVTPFLQEAEAREFFARVQTQWTEAYLCRVIQRGMAEPMALPPAPEECDGAVCECGHCECAHTFDDDPSGPGCTECKGCDGFEEADASPAKETPHDN